MSASFSHKRPVRALARQTRAIQKLPCIGGLGPAVSRDLHVPIPGRRDIAREPVRPPSDESRSEIGRAAWKRTPPRRPKKLRRVARVFMSAYAQLKPLFDSGSERTRLPVAAKMALVTAGRIGGSDGSPRPGRRVVRS